VNPRARLSQDEQARRIRRWIRREGRRVVARHPALKHQDALGAGFCLAGVAGMLSLGWLYALSWIPAWACVLLNAFFASILHEIEHDLIHFLYFKNRPAAHHTMMFLVWLFRGNVVHGWHRRRIHLHHHRASGSATDVEERILGLGQPLAPRRLLMMVDGAAAFFLNARTLEREVEGFRRRRLALASIPVYPVFVLVLLSYFGFRAFGLDAPGAIDVLAFAWVFPNYIRQAALQIVSSNVHYFEDVESVHQETQVLSPWFFWPLQLLCFNFGTTHSLHHYVVEQPFYLRQLAAPRVLPAMRRHGVRFNDVGTFFRANRFRIA
jgi:fatty acid desaturase